MTESKDQALKRLEKALEVRKALLKLGINDEICPDLKPFFTLMNDWIREGGFKEGKIKLPEINKKIVYQLASPKYTVVKLSPLQ